MGTTLKLCYYASIIAAGLLISDPWTAFLTSMLVAIGLPYVAYLLFLLGALVYGQAE